MTGRILIIDDEPLIVFEIEDTLKEAGFEIAGMASTLKKALDLAASADNVDCALLDANLQEEISRPVLEILQEKDIPCIIISGYSRDQIGGWVKDLPLVRKPFVYTELVETVRKVVAGG